MLLRLPSRRLFLLFFGLIVGLYLYAPSILLAQGDNLGVAIIIGERHAWMIESPEDWNLDQRNALASGLGAAFVPEWDSWSSSPVVMYANTIPKEFDTITVAGTIAADSVRAIQQFHASVKRQQPLGTIQGVDAEVCHVTRRDSSLFEAIAYINGPTAIAIIVLSSRDAEKFEDSLPSFARLVDSYEWITSDPEQIAELKGMR
ncbi:MAG: hypothetical protein KDD67_10250 [Ignavibacteriae bacterium]|nr:hypothetical protein [Ignavibacteriota bacterium]MCB9214809.1 hypothetical protein [Ignavibacteria bacterium]